MRRHLMDDNGPVRGTVRPGLRERSPWEKAGKHPILTAEQQEQHERRLRALEERVAADLERLERPSNGW